MTLCLGIYGGYLTVKVGLIIHNDFMRKWNQAKAEGRL